MFEITGSVSELSALLDSAGLFVYSLKKYLAALFCPLPQILKFIKRKGLNMGRRLI